MDWAKKCCAIIPCCNEGTTAGSLVSQLRPLALSAYVVDDGSADDTRTVSAEAGARVLHHPGNLGKGAALRTGLSSAFAAGFAWAITLDGDGQHKPQDIHAFFASAERTGAALVIGNRMHDPNAIPWLRRQVNRWMSRQLSHRAGRQLPDTQCGFRLIDLNVWSTLRLSKDRFEVESEMLLAFIEAGYPIDFVPIQVVGRANHSHIHPVADAWRWLRWWKESGLRTARPSKIRLAAQTHLPVRRSKCFTNAGAGSLADTPKKLLCARSLPAGNGPSGNWTA